MGSKTPETGIISFRGKEIPQVFSLVGPYGREDIFLNPVSVEADSYRQRLVLEGTTPTSPDKIGGRVRVDYFQLDSKIFKREQIYSEVDGNRVLSSCKITYNQGSVALIYSIRGSMFVTPRLDQDPDNYDLDIQARLIDQPVTFPPLAGMEYRNPPSSYPYRAFITHGEWTQLMVGQVEQEQIKSFGELEIDWRKLRYYFTIGRGWRVMDEKPEYRGHGVPMESFKDIIANSTRRSRVATSPYSFKVGYKETGFAGDEQLALHRFNTGTQSLWVFSVPAWLNRAEVLNKATSDHLDNFISEYPVSLSIKERKQPKQVFST